MHRIPARRTAAVLVVLGLLIAAFPAAAAPGRATDQPQVRAWVQTLMAWFATLSPASGTAFGVKSAWSPLGPDADPNGEPQATSSDPTPRTELGSGLDPNG